ncbi:translation initiation factor IF-2-like [Manacus candei]|uniref:translation initiation factor IF-2-like n=1 Tax=Manacus candei TaxID=415023 RepID=UPI002226AAE1|nr:translation initiation factor IF-2-like [Manacus candei]
MLIDKVGKKQGQRPLLVNWLGIGQRVCPLSLKAPPANTGEGEKSNQNKKRYPECFPPVARGEITAGHNVGTYIEHWFPFPHFRSLRAPEFVFKADAGQHLLEVRLRHQEPRNCFIRSWARLPEKARRIHPTPAAPSSPSEEQLLQMSEPPPSLLSATTPEPEREVRRRPQTAEGRGGLFTRRFPCLRAEEPLGPAGAFPPAPGRLQGAAAPQEHDAAPRGPTRPSPAEPPGTGRPLPAPPCPARSPPPTPEDRPPHKGPRGRDPPPRRSPPSFTCGPGGRWLPLVGALSAERGGGTGSENPGSAAVSGAGAAATWDRPRACSGPAAGTVRWAPGPRGERGNHRIIKVGGDL